MVMEALEPRILLSTFYVATTGSDSNAGSQAAPFATLQYGMRALNPGDTLNVEPGNYAGFVIGWDIQPASGDPYGTIDGTAARPITIQADPAHPGAAITSKDNKTQWGIDFEPGVNFINLVGLTVDGSSGGMAEYPNHGGGIKVCGTADNVIGCTVQNINYGFGVFTDNGTDDLIQSNTITNIQAPPNSLYGHGIYLSGTSDGQQVLGNTIFNNAYIGIHINGDVGEGGLGLVTHAIIEGNLIYNNGQNGINADGLQDSTIQNNQIYNYASYGICLFQGDASGPSKNNVIENNEIVAGDTTTGAAVRILNGSTGNTITHNLVLGAAQGTFRISADSLPGFTSNDNLVSNLFQSEDTGTTETLAQWQASTGQDEQSVISTLANSFYIEPGNSYGIGTTPVWISYAAGPDIADFIVGWLSTGELVPASSAANCAIGWADSSDAGNPANVPANTVEIRYTLLGDANLDGKVNSIDFAILSSHYNQAGVWDEGDFNGDGKVNSVDFALLSNNLGDSI